MQHVLYTLAPLRTFLPELYLVSKRSMPEKRQEASSRDGAISNIYRSRDRSLAMHHRLVCLCLGCVQVFNDASFDVAYSKPLGLWSTIPKVDGVDTSDLQAYHPRPLPRIRILMLGLTKVQYAF